MSENLIIGVIGVIKISMQSFTRLVGSGSKSEDWHGARRTSWCTSSAETRLIFCRTFLVSGGLNTRECESEGKKERMTENVLMKNELKVFAKVAIDVPDVLKISTISFRSQDGRSHLWVRRLYRNLCGNHWDSMMDEIVEHTAIM